MKSLKFKIITALIFLVLILVVSCNGDVGGDNPPQPVPEKIKAFQIGDSTESYDTLKQAVRALQEKSKTGSSAASESYTIRLNCDKSDQGAEISGINAEVILDLQENTLTLENGSAGIVIDNLGNVVIKNGTIKVADGAVLKARTIAVITANTNASLSVSVNASNTSVDAIATTGGSLNISGSVEITTRDDHKVIVAMEDSVVNVESDQVVLTGGIKLDDNADVDLGNAKLNLTQDIEKGDECKLDFNEERVVPQNDNVSQENISEAKHNHQFSNDWKTDGTYHWHTAECHQDIKSSIGTHVWSEWQTATEATHTENGLKIRSCSVCGKIEIMIVPADSDNHTWDNGHVSRSPNCTDPGEMYYTCTYCGRVRTEAIEALGHNWEETGLTLPTATAQGYTTYTCTRCGSTRKGNFVSPLGFEFGDPAWTWSDDNCSITAEFTSLNDPLHSEVVHGSITIEALVSPTCTDGGKNRLTASVEFNGISYTTYKDVDVSALGHDYVNHEPKAATCDSSGWNAYRTCSRCDYSSYSEIPALGHDYGQPTWVWESDKSAATASFVCKNDADHVETVVADITDEVTTEPTCTSVGTRIYTASVRFGDKTFSDTSTGSIGMLDHTYKKAITAPTETEDGFTTYTCVVCGYSYIGNIVPPESYIYGEPVWTWADDHSSATARFNSINVINHFVEAVDSSIGQSVTKAPTCTESGEMTFTATVDFNGESYTASTTAEIRPTGHAYPDNPDWVWNDDNSRATAIFICGNDIEHVESVGDYSTSVITKEATCTGEGERVYTSSISFNGERYSTSKTVALPALGHKYTSPEWKWSEDLSTATAIFRCERDSSHDTSRTVETSCEDLISATCENTGIRQYVAIVEFGGQSFSSGVRNVVLPALGHDFPEEPEWSWSDDFSSATAKFVCGNDDSHVETVSCDSVTEVLKESSCLEKGSINHSVSVVFGGKTYSTSIMTEAEALGHDYVHHDAKEPSCSEIGWDEYDSCSRCDFTSYSPIEPLGHNYTAEITEPTATTQGFTTYTCGRCGYSYTGDYKSALGHVLGEPEWIWADDCLSAVAVFTCQNEENHIERINASVDERVTTVATCTASGVLTYTAVVELDGLVYTETKTKELNALGHNYPDNPVWTWSEDNNTVTATFVCKNDRSHVEEVSTTSSKVIREASCTEAGEVFYSASITFGGKTYSTYKTVKIEPLGHDIAHHASRNPSCEEVGWNAYDDCSRCNYTTYVEIPALGHSFSEDWTVSSEKHWHASTCGHDVKDQEGCHSWTEENICSVCGCRNEGAGSALIIDPVDYSPYIEFPDEWGGSLIVVPSVSGILRAFVEPECEDVDFVFYVDGRIVSLTGNSLVLGRGSGKVELGYGYHIIAVKAFIGQTSYTKQYIISVSDSGRGTEDTL